MKFKRSIQPLKLRDIIVAVAFVLVCGIIFLISRTEEFITLQKTLQVRTVPASILRFGTMGDILRKLHRVSFTTNDYRRFQSNEHHIQDINAITFQKKRAVGDVLVVANPTGVVKYSSTTFAKSAQQKTGWPIFSISIDQKSLNDPDVGILVNRDKKGRDWEKIVQVTYLEKNNVIFETYAGLRMHGGLRLTTKKFKPGFRLYFRKKYGMETIAKGLILKDTKVPIRTLVLQTVAWPPDYPMNNPLAYDISRKIGCVVPETRLVELYINGKSYGMMFAVEHLSRRQWGQRYSSENYNFYKFRSQNSFADKKMYVEKFWKTVSAKPKHLEEISHQNINLENFSRHLFSWVFAGTTDYCQGVAVYDNLNSAAGVSWINWDMDHSFYDLQSVKYDINRKNWEQEAFQIVYKKRHYCGRTKLFSRLMNESKDYRHKFISLVTEILNHRLTSSFLQSRVAYYEHMLEIFEAPHHDYIRMLYSFMDHRADFVREDMRERFGLTGSFNCTIIGKNNQEFLVDGYPYSSKYSGTYFQSTPIVISLPLKEKRLGYWIVNGKKIIKEKLYLHLHEDTTVSYVIDRK